MAMIVKDIGKYHINFEIYWRASRKPKELHENNVRVLRNNFYLGTQPSKARVSRYLLISMT